MLRKLASHVLLATFGTAFIAMAVPLYKVHRVQAGIDAATARLTAGQPERAMQELRDVEPWAYGNSSLALELNIAMIRALTRLARDQDAEERAEWLRTTPAMTTGRARFLIAPGGLWALLTTIPESLCERLVAHQSDVPIPFQWDRWTGYVVLRAELGTTGRGEIAESMAQKLSAISAENPFADLLPRASVHAGPESVTPSGAHQARPRAPVEATPPTETSHQPTAEEMAAIAHVIADLVHNDTALAKDPQNADALAACQKLIPKAVPAWGVVRKDAAPIFDVASVEKLNPVRDGSLPAGTFVDVVRMLAPGSMTLAVARASETERTKPFVIRLRDLDLRAGPLDVANAKERQLRAARARLLAALDTLRRQRKPRDSDNAPETRTFMAALAKRNAYYAEMKKHMDIIKRGGPSADASYDALRKMKYDQAEVDRVYSEAKQTYQTWQRSSGGDDTDDKRVAELEEQLAAVDRELEGISHGAAP